MAYSGNNSNYYNVTDGFMYYMTSGHFINHGANTTNVMFTPGNVRTIRMIPGVSPWREDFTLKPM